MLIPYTFNILTHFLSFTWQIIYLKNVDMYTFWRGGEDEKVCFVHSIKCWQFWTVPKMIGNVEIYKDSHEQINKFNVII